MATLGRVICLLAAYLIMADAFNDTNTNSTAKSSDAPAAPPQNQFGFVYSMYNQTSPPPNGPITRSPTLLPNIGVGSVSYTDDSSSEESDIDMDVDGVPSYVVGRFGNRVSGNQVSGNRVSGNRVSGNTRPMFPGNRRQQVMSGMPTGDLDGDFMGDYDQLIGRSTGTSGKDVGIALGVLGLVALVIAAAFFTIRRQRNNMATFERLGSTTEP